jgi:hypothetical protein
VSGIHTAGTLSKFSSARRIAVLAVFGALLLAACPTPDDPRNREDPPPITYTLTFHANGGNPAPAAQTVTKGGTAAAPGAMTRLPDEGLYQADIATLRGAAVFGGWYTDAALTTAWSPGAPVTGNLNLHAKWTGTPPAPVDISGQSGSHTLDRALAYITAQSLAITTSYTIMLDGTYTLAGVSSPNITTSNALITLAGRGPTDINLSSGGSLFRIGAGKLILDNHITLRGQHGNNDSLVYVDGSSAALVMKAGSTITGNSATDDGGGVKVRNGGSFTMQNGVIAGNSAVDDGQGHGGGGGVAVESGSNFTITGGEISGNTSEHGSGGGGVSVQNGSSFTMVDGVISGNSATNEGGGVAVADNGEFTMEGGVIAGNSTTGVGGGVFVNAGSFTMEDGVISDNIAGGDGGGVFAVDTNSSFTMNGGVISGNTATGDGGGVKVDGGTFTMQDGVISGNIASGEGGENGGGGVSVVNCGTFVMKNNATVSGNIATSTVKVFGGGVHLSDSEFTMYGNAAVKGNRAITTGSVSGDHGIGNAEGGGVCVNGAFTMYDNAIVAGNTASSNSAWAEGGGVEVHSNGVFILSGGTVYGDIAHGVNASLANTVTTTSGNTRGATVYNGGTAQYGDGTNIDLENGGTDLTLNR